MKEKSGTESNHYIQRSLSEFQINILYKNALSIFIMTILMTVVYGLVLHGEAHHFRLMLWIGCMLGVTLIRGIISFVYFKIDFVNRNYRFWGNSFILSSLVSGLTLAMVAYLLPAGFSFQHVYILILIIAMMAGAVSSLSPYMPVFYAYFLTLYIVYLSRLIQSSFIFPENHYLVGITVLFLLGPISLIRFAKQNNTTLKNTWLMFKEKEKLAKQLEIEQGQLLLSDTVLQNIKEGVIITDHQNRIIKTNKYFSEISGYNEEEVIGKYPSALGSKKQDAKFYESMWSSIIEKGSWSGEIWNRRKNGEIYPESLNITTLRNKQNEIINYIGNFRDISSIKMKEDELYYLAHNDLLTGLPNRKSIYEYLDINLSTIIEDRREMSILFLDLNLFKNINDEFGHNIGDLLLREVALRLKETLRETDMVGRLGGDEFAVILTGADKKETCQVADQISESIQQEYILHNIKCHIGVSIGITFAPQSGLDRKELMNQADTAMYNAKKKLRENKNEKCWEIYRSDESRQNQSII